MIDHFQENHGYIKTKDFRDNRKLLYELQAMVQKGEVVQIKRGMYKHPQYSTRDHWQEVSLIYPTAVVYLFSSFVFYNLSTYMPNKLHLAINRKSKLTIVPYMPAKLHYIRESFFHKHIINIKGVNVYSMERTVCDAIKQEKQIGTDIMTEVVKNYFKMDTADLDKLSKTAREIRTEQKVSRIMNIMVNL